MSEAIMITFSELLKDERIKGVTSQFAFYMRIRKEIEKKDGEIKGFKVHQKSTEKLKLKKNESNLPNTVSKGTQEVIDLVLLDPEKIISFSLKIIPKLRGSGIGVSKQVAPTLEQVKELSYAELLARATEFASKNRERTKVSDAKVGIKEEDVKLVEINDTVGNMIRSLRGYVEDSNESKSNELFEKLKNRGNPSQQKEIRELNVTHLENFPQD